MEEALKALEFAADCGPCGADGFFIKSFQEQTEAALAAAAALTVIAMDAGEDLQRFLEEIRCEPRLLPSQRGIYDCPWQGTSATLSWRSGRQGPSLTLLGRFGRKQ